MSNLAPSRQSLAGKVALVTGGSRGIGAGIVRRLARDGAKVAFTYSGSKERAAEVMRIVREAGGEAIAIQADSADVVAIRAAVEKTVQAFDRLDILVNNAALGKLAPIEEVSLDDFDKMIAVNVKGVFIATQESLRHIGNGGRIINIGSINSDFVPYKNASVYALTKGAVASFTHGLARDLGPRGITVNTVQPGPIDTEMNPATGPFAEFIRGSLAVPRYGHVDEVAAMVAYLAGPEAGFVTGSSFRIDGGAAA